MCILYASEIKIKIYSIKTCVESLGGENTELGGVAQQSFLSKRFQKAIVWGESLKNKNKKRTKAGGKKTRQ